MKKFRDKRVAILAILLVAVILRVGLNIAKEKAFSRGVFPLPKGVYRLKNSDGVWYNETARAFLNGEGIMSLDQKVLGEHNFYAWNDLKKVEGSYYAHKAVAPLYPLFLALCYSIGGFNIFSYFVPQLILGSLTCAFIYLLAEEIFNRKIALLAGLAVAFYPDLIFWVRCVRVETLFIFFLALGFLFLIKGNTQGDILFVFIGAVAFGLACLTRITFIPFVPILFFWQAIFFKNDGKRNIKAAFLMSLLIVLMLFPWCMRNFLVFGKFTPFSDEVYAFLVKPHSISTIESEHYYLQTHSLLLRLAGFIKDNPGKYFIGFLKNFAAFWSPITPFMRPLAKVYKFLTWILVFPVAFFGMIASRRRWERSGILIIFIFYYALLHAASFVDRGLVYRYPIQPFLCVFAAYGFWVICKEIVRKKHI